MKAATPTTHGINPNLKLFALIVAAIIVALVAFTVGKSLWNNHEASLAKTQADAQKVLVQKRVATQNDIASLKELETKIGKPDNVLSQTDNGIWYANDLGQIWWIQWLATNPDACDRMPNTTYCDVRHPDGTWGYSKTLQEAQAELKKDVDSYNALATKLVPDSLPAGMPTKYDDSGHPINN